jgi:D-alanyl-D-alanine carboxypeptidase/D-alanyl-D-alanine-endopeptidase (penicillin-binding protein 4)
MKKLLALLLFAATAHATPTAAPQPPKHDGAHARVAVAHAGGMRPAREAVGRREEPLSLEEDTARQIERLLRGPLRSGITGLFVADARTGEPLFAVNADDPLNPASNVKMISTATALELLGPEFRYSTRLLGPEPDESGAIRGNVYLLGTWDPTLSTTDFDDVAKQIAASGVTELDGDVVIGADQTRDGIFRAIVPIEIRGGGPGEAPTAIAPAGFDLITFDIKAKTAKKAQRAALTYTDETVTDGAGHLRVQLTINGTIGKGGTTMYPLLVKERSADAAHALRAALRAHLIKVNGDVKVQELGDFIGDAVLGGALPIEIARHESAPLHEIVAHVNKWSINWLADRVIMTAAALSRREAPSMELALDAMYGWLARHAHLAKSDVLVDTGSGLSYHTRITPHELVSVVRCAAGYMPDADPTLAHAWVESLAIGGTDGTLGHRFRSAETRGHLHGKTGTLSTVIALSGIIDIDPSRPLAFSIVTNGDRPLSKGYVRKAHEQVVNLIVKYIARTSKTPVSAEPVKVEAPAAHAAIPDDLEGAVDDPQLDAEASGQRATPP